MTRQLSLPGDGIRLGTRICSKNIPSTSLLNWHRWLPGVSSFDATKKASRRCLACTLVCAARAY